MINYVLHNNIPSKIYNNKMLDSRTEVEISKLSCNSRIALPPSSCSHLWLCSQWWDLVGQGLFTTEKCLATELLKVGISKLSTNSRIALPHS